MSSVVTMQPSPIIIYILPPQGTMVHSMLHSLRARPEEGGRDCVVYSLCHHQKEACLLTAGSFGPVKVWRSADWREGEEEEEEEEGKLATMAN